MANFFSEMLKCKRYIYDHKDRGAALAFKEVQRFVETGKYSSCKKAAEIGKRLLAGYSKDEIAQLFNLSPETIRTNKKNMSAELWLLFPSDFFDRLCDYANNRDYIKSCLYSISTYDVTSDKIVLLDVLREISNRSDGIDSFDYSLQELGNELDFLLRYSKGFLENEFASVDIDKLAYILKVLDKKKVSPSLKRSDVVKILMSNEKE